MNKTIFGQDLPPNNGYKPIYYKRIPSKVIFGGITWIGIYVATTTAGLFVYYQNCKLIKREEIEMRSSRHAILPLLIAERDREFLKQLNRNREEESSLMTNVKGWDVGTWFGEPVFKSSAGKDVLTTPIFKEYYVHCGYEDYAKRANVKLWS